jgi:hypothetical protein
MTDDRWRPQVEERNVERWLERNSNDPDDYEGACRRLVAIIYKGDENHDLDTMLRRSTPQELYRSLKQQYWHLVHTRELDEIGTNRIAQKPRLKLATR